MPLFRALAKNMAPMTNADESPTNRLTLFPIYLSLFIVSTLCLSSLLAQERRMNQLRTAEFGAAKILHVKIGRDCCIMPQTITPDKIPIVG